MEHTTETEIRDRTSRAQNEPVLLTLAAAGRRLGVHWATVKRWIEAGDLPALVVGGSWRIHAAAIDELEARVRGVAVVETTPARTGYETWISPTGERTEVQIPDSSVLTIDEWQREYGRRTNHLRNAGWQPARPTRSGDQ